MPEEKNSFNPNIIFERRRFVRVEGSFVVSYKDITTSEGKSDITQTKNISLGGILFTTDREFPPGTLLRLNMRLPYVSTYINVKAQVVDCTKKGILYNTRAKFVGLKDEDKEAINRIIEYNLRQRGL